MAERTLHTILDGFQKVELQDLGNILGNHLNARLRKSQLVDQLHTYLRGEPRRWMSHLLERDVRLLREMVQAGPEKVRYQEFADYPSLLEVSGLLQSDDSDEHFHKVWITREVYDIVALEIDDVIHSCEQNGQFEVERMMLGYLNLYGIVPTEQFISMLAEWYEKACGGDFYKLSHIMHQSPLLKMYRYIDSRGDYVCTPCMDWADVDEVFYLRKEFRQKQFKPFSYEQVREAGTGAPYFNLGMKTPDGMRVEQMFRHLGYSGLELVTVLHDTWIEAQHTADVNHRLLDPLYDSPRRVLDDASFNECIHIVLDYANSLPKWVLNGYSSSETGLCLQEGSAYDDASRPAEEGKYAFGLAVPHVAPDDPCPCGSGLRYCRCHGKYMS